MFYMLVFVFEKIVCIADRSDVGQGGFKGALLYNITSGTLTRRLILL